MGCHGARQLMQQGLYAKARAELEREIHGGELTPVELADAFNLLCLAQTRLSDYYAAVRCGELALQLGMEHDLENFTALAYYRLGTALTFLGDTPMALEYLQVFLDNPGSSTEAPALVPVAHFNIGINLVKRREYADAIRAYQKAANLFESAGNLHYCARSWREITWCLLHLDRADTAESYLQRLEAYAAEHEEDEHIHNVLLVDKAFYHHKKQQVATSMGYCQELFQPGRRGVTPEHLCEAAWVAGLNAVDLGHLDEAAMFAAMATEQASLAKWPFMLNQANALRRRIAQARDYSGV